MIKRIHLQCGRPVFDPRAGKIPWRRAWQPTPVFFLENSMDRGAWQATVHWVAKSRTQLKGRSPHTRRDRMSVTGSVSVEGISF